MANQVSVSTAYISAGVNLVSNCILWTRDWFVYGINHSIGLAELSDSHRQLKHTLTGHTGRVNCLSSVIIDSEINLLISGSSDHSIVIWKSIPSFQLKSEFSVDPYSVLYQLKGHSGSVTSIDSFLKNDKNSQKVFVASTSVDSTIRIWMFNTDSISSPECTQIISLNNGICHCLKFIHLPNRPNSPLLCCALDNMKIVAYVLTPLADGSPKEFVESASLTGHEDWVRCLDFIQWNGDIYLASCSQDNYIRIWKFHECVELDKLQDDSIIKTRELTLSHCEGPKISITVDAVLSGHENWVLGVCWHLDSATSRPFLLSASMDKSMIVWHQVTSGSSYIWSELVRVGDVGGNNLGLLGCSFSPDGRYILAHGFHGGLYMWSRPEQDASASVWSTEVSPGGHFASVEDICWEPSNGWYLLSVSQDQTTRLHAPWRRQDNSDGEWHEIARPQVHGYDMTGIACLDGHNFVSIGDEKVARSFRSPHNFRTNFGLLTQSTIPESELLRLGDIPEGAMVPALGLSNKAVKLSDTQYSQLDAYMEDLMIPCQDAKNQYSQAYFKPQTFQSPPTEDNLLQNTLWPETRKLYGHGFEVYSIASHPDGYLFATACKASKAEHAAIIIWSVPDWTIKQKLVFHQLTVTQLGFSHSGRELISVSRDRCWSLWRQDKTEEFVLAKHSAKKGGHSRIIWSVDWSFDDKYFVTGSRDKRLLMWSPSSDTALDSGHSCNESVTAVAFSPRSNTVNSKYVLAFGLEDGHVSLLSWQPPGCSPSGWSVLQSFNTNLSHHSVVKRLRFRPVCGFIEKKQCGEDKNVELFQLASCSSDHCVKVYNISITAPLT